MYWETMPGWFWVIYYGFLAVTFLTAVIRITQKRKFLIEIPLLILVVTIPVVGLLNSADSIRLVEQNEVGFFLSQLNQGAAWTIFFSRGLLCDIGVVDWTVCGKKKGVCEIYGIKKVINC